MYSDNTLCPLCERSIDTQEHIAHCQVLKNCITEANVIDYTHLTGTLEQQASFITSYEKLLEARDELLSEASDPLSSLPGLYSGPLHSKARTSRTPATGSKGDRFTFFSWDLTNNELFEIAPPYMIIRPSL